MSLIRWIKNNGTLITAIGSIAVIFSITGFSINIPEYYGSLEPEGKILFVLIFNTLLTIVLFSIAINKKTRSSRTPRRRKSKPQK